MRTCMFQKCAPIQFAYEPSWIVMISRMSRFLDVLVCCRKKEATRPSQQRRVMNSYWYQLRDKEFLPIYAPCEIHVEVVCSESEPGGDQRASEKPLLPQNMQSWVCEKLL